MAKRLLAVLTLIAIAQGVYYYPHLPQEMASHFGSSGEPNAWSSRNLFFVIYYAAISIVLVIFFLVPIAIRQAPISRFNLPNKAYWLAPERREITFNFIANQFHWFGVVHLTVIIAVIQFAISANLRSNAILPSTPIWLLLLAYGVYVIVWLLRFFLKFKKPEN